MKINSVSNGFSLRRSLEDQGVTLETDMKHHLAQAMILMDCGSIKSFADYRV